ncbi:hypothetical protein SISSUDRAFT_1128481 [Sistotremastrum suecicum HHB10207 ss-3]|uniref:Uncharacterized protein n=1 Tax=Sistotremastrum suecicum HHB10207 ss-3 TaxID=1314776 RepID=A0A166DUJ3_9AGAM|nr:hypothetical protein SISSUDRAFT_1128481 [Sistotremastrum suecicum HHB10207 ss-3]
MSFQTSSTSNLIASSSSSPRDWEASLAALQSSFGINGQAPCLPTFSKSSKRSTKIPQKSSRGPTPSPEPFQGSREEIVPEWSATLITLAIGISYDISTTTYIYSSYNFATEIVRDSRDIYLVTTTSIMIY